MAHDYTMALANMSSAPNLLLTNNRAVALHVSADALIHAEQEDVVPPGNNRSSSPATELPVLGDAPWDPKRFRV